MEFRKGSNDQVSLTSVMLCVFTFTFFFFSVSKLQRLYMELFCFNHFFILVIRGTTKMINKNGDTIQGTTICFKPTKLILTFMFFYLQYVALSREE